MIAIRAALCAALILACGAAVAKETPACVAALKTLDPMMKEATRESAGLKTLPPVMGPSGQRLPDDVLGRSCAAWAQYDFKSLQKKLDGIATRGRAAGRSCSAREAAFVNKTFLNVDLGFKYEVADVKKMCAQTGHPW